MNDFAWYTAVLDDMTQYGHQASLRLISQLIISRVIQKLLKYISVTSFQHFVPSSTV